MPSLTRPCLALPVPSLICDCLTVSKLALHYPAWLCTVQYCPSRHPCPVLLTMLDPVQARIQGGGGRWGGCPLLGRRDPHRRCGFFRLKGRKKGHWCLLNGCSTPFKHNMAMNILKSCKFVFAYVKNRSSPSHIRSSIPWRPPLAEILDPRLLLGLVQPYSTLTDLLSPCPVLLGLGWC